ncbi:MAG: hypothetical protein IKE30_03565 [Clostridia bacterium]|nr:hypothetical protein [Clostridia bacterium]
MKCRTGVVLLILALLFALSAYAETSWTCGKCGRRVQAVFSDECPYCGAKRHVHRWREATCTEPKTCAECGATEGEALGHQWGEGRVIQEATCLETGEELYICTVCGFIQDRIIPKDPDNHAGGTEVRARIEATCTGNGYTGDTYCKGCGELIGKGSAIAAPGHQWGKSRVIREATCCEAGEELHTCTVCRSAQVEEIPKDPDSHVGGTEVKGRIEAACTADGYTGDTYCKGCGEVIVKGSAIAAPGHQWSAGRTIREATCREAGEELYTCTVCGFARIEEIPKDPGNHVGETETRFREEATCTRDGYTGDIYCKGCGERIGKGSGIAALGHLWQEATYTAPKTCARCGATEGEPLKRIPAVGDIIAFGRYPQTASGADSTPVKWIVLDIRDNKALLLSKYGLDTKRYNDQHKEVTWETCTLRKWLNGEFMNNAFSADEQAKIASTVLRNPGETLFKKADGNDTDDRIFLLSYVEANLYFGVTGLTAQNERVNNLKPRASVTEYAAARGAYSYSDYETAEGEAAGAWWLRSPGYEYYYAALVDCDGTLWLNYDVDEDVISVRPAMWVKLES